MIIKTIDEIRSWKAKEGYALDFVGDEKVVFVDDLKKAMPVCHIVNSQHDCCLFVKKLREKF